MIPRKESINPGLIGKVVIREMVDTDSERVLEIYKMGIESGMATFETDIPSWKEFSSSHHKHSRFIIELNNQLVGWAALSAVSKRDAYRGVAEVSIYLDENNLGGGLGSMLMEKVITSSELNGIWTLFSSVFPENQASVRLHEKFGFRIIGKRERIGQIDGKWRDTLILELRSRKVGL
jgi:L-amino acid N-acyltransferase YncA